MKEYVMLNNLKVIFFIFLPVLLGAQEDILFDDYFTSNTMRIDYFHTGDANDEMIIMDRIYQQSLWPGTRLRLTKPVNLGDYQYTVYDNRTGKLIFVQDFDTYFGEYQTTDPARKGIRKSYHESAIIPFPKDSIIFAIDKRDRQQKFHSIFEVVIDPGDYHIIQGETGDPVDIIEIQINENIQNAVDIVILGDGYTHRQKVKFEADLHRFTRLFFDWEPYSRFKEKFNIRGVFTASPDSGVDEPRRRLYRNTVFNCTFNSLDSERYLLTENNKAIRDIAGLVPYDAILIMANTNRYGGGGIYNTYCVFSSDDAWSEFVMHHEFGHSFAGLADEYFSPEDTYEEFYPRGIEPLKPNITALLDPNHVKWEEYLTPGIQIPTPWNKEIYEQIVARYDSISANHNRRLKDLHNRSATDEEIDAEDKEYRTQLNDNREKLSDFFANHPLKGKVGVFQGAGYDAEQLYRPTINSIMHRFSRTEKSFYPVNEAAITDKIYYYTE